MHIMMVRILLHDSEFLTWNFFSRGLRVGQFFGHLTLRDQYKNCQ